MGCVLMGKISKDNRLDDNRLDDNRLDDNRLDENGDAVWNTRENGRGFSQLGYCVNLGEILQKRRVAIEKPETKGKWRG